MIKVLNCRPTNPWSFRGLYVSNVKPTEETKQVLLQILSGYGKVTLIDFIAESETAIINFDNPESPRKAMSCLQVSPLYVLMQLIALIN